MEYLLIVSYLNGFVISYVILRNSIVDNDKEYKWEDVAYIVWLSIFSWLTLLVVFGMYLFFKFIRKIKVKVPKWL